MRRREIVRTVGVRGKLTVIAQAGKMNSRG